MFCNINALSYSFAAIFASFAQLYAAGIQKIYYLCI